jgi:NDP-sugar pyrophosphorylase family protein
MKAMIFAAGLGKRLGKLTENIPKALVEINGRSILQVAIEKAVSHGFDDIIVNVHHFADKVEEEISGLRKMGFNIAISDERNLLLETGGGLFKARWFFDEKPFLLYNTDIITDLDLSVLYSYHIENSGIATLAVRNRPGNRLLLVDDSGLLKGWRNKSAGEEILVSQDSGDLHETGFSGIHVVNPEIFQYMEDGVYSLTPLYLKLAQKHRILTYNHDAGYWADIGTPENLEKIRKTFNHRPATGL